MNIKTHKYLFKMVFVSVSLFFLILLFNCSAVSQQSSKSKEAVATFISSSIGTQGGRMESYFISGDAFTKVKMPEDDDDHQICLIWNNPPVFNFEEALKKYSFEKAEYDDTSKFSLHFYDRNNKSLLWIYIGYNHPAIIINGESFQPTSELMQSMRYFMPYIAYWQISHSAQYEQYFKETEKKQDDPNSVKK